MYRRRARAAVLFRRFERRGGAAIGRACRPTNATPLQRRHRCSLQLSARPVIAPGALERPRRAVQRALGQTRRDGIVSRSGFDSDAPTARATPHATRISKPDAVSHVTRPLCNQLSEGRQNHTSLWPRETIKNARRDNPTTPSGPAQYAINKFLPLARRPLFWLACQSAKR